MTRRAVEAGKKDPFSSKRAYSGHSYVHPLTLLVKFLPSNQRTVDSITTRAKTDSANPNYERVPSFKDPIRHY
ncbi:HMA domain-containing protein [Psidium guajava]|nr:HMA domain-containing protein [Psidium guajava]